MLESQVRAVLEQLAGGEPPPSRVDIGLARSRGRRLLRWRRAGLAGAPLLAAAAVAGVIVAAGAVGGSPRGAGGPAAGGSHGGATGRFNPLVRYASFGWLPPGQSVWSGGTGRTQMYLNAGPKPGIADWPLTVFADGCQLAARVIDCTGGASSGLRVDITGRAPAVAGRRAYWGGGYLIWEYTRGGWAWLGMPMPSPHPAQVRLVAVKIASHVRFGRAAARSIAFPAQLTGVPGRWRVSSVYYRPDGAVLRASQYSVTAGAVVLGAGSGEFQPNIPFFTVDPATSKSSCYQYPGGKSVHEVIDGYPVTVTQLPSTNGNPPGQYLCATNADGLAVFIGENGTHPALGVVALFAHHLRLLGANPAKWTTTPIIAGRRG